MFVVHSVWKNETIPALRSGKPAKRITVATFDEAVKLTADLSARGHAVHFYTDAGHRQIHMSGVRCREFLAAQSAAA